MRATPRPSRPSCASASAARSAVSTAPVANLVKADEECALAIETALGAAAQNIVVDTQNDGRSAIELLKKRDAGRATFLPVDTIRGSVMRDAPVNDPGFVGMAYDLVRFDSQYENIIANLLGRTVIAETLSDAIRMSKSNGNRLRIVTLDGQVINAGGSMTGGSTAKGQRHPLACQRAREARKQRERSLRKQEKSCRDELEKAKSQLSGLRYQLDMAMEDQTAGLTEESGLARGRKAHNAKRCAIS